MEIHKKFSIPIACLVFALLGVAPRRQQPPGRQAGQLRPRHRRHLRLLRDHVHGAGDDQGRAAARVAGDVGAEHRARRGRRCCCSWRARAASMGPFASRCPCCLAAREGAGLPAQPGQPTRRRPPRRPRRAAAPRGGRHPHPALPPAAAESARSLRRQAVRAHAGDGGRGDGWACSTSRPSSTCRTSGSRGRRRSACCSRISAGRRRSSCTTSSRLRCCSSALVTIGLLTKNSELDRDARLRHQPLSHGGAAAGVRAWPPAACCSRFEERVLAVTNRRAEYLQPHHSRRHRRRPSTCSIASG